MRRVLITGGASGIGRAMAERFAEAGGEPWVVDCDSSLLADCPPDWRRSALDVSDEAAVAALFEQLVADWGGLEVLCCNAGIAGPTARIEDVELADWRRCLQVNLEGAFLFSKYAAPLFKAQGSGAILFTSSTAGLHGFPARAPYAASKWALHGLMKTLAMELGPFGVRANAICPGSVEGARIESVLQREALIKGGSRDAVYQGYVLGTSMRSFVTADDIARMAVFLGSDSARMVSGQIISVDGHTENPDPKL